MRRFLPARIVAETIENDAFWPYLTSVICTECEQVVQSLGNISETPKFKM